DKQSSKPYALDVLHSDRLNPNRNQGRYNPDLCGSVQGGVKPSPVWINDQTEYQVVTVFGATQEPRKGFVDELKRAGAIQIFPIA
ncbi:MAG: type III-B CRISPR module RAMP protein Cmr6, partial [Cyanobacteria bacterium M5B4]